MATTFWIQRSAMALGIVLLALCTSLRAQGQISPGQQRALSTLNAIAMALPPESANTEIRWLTDSARNTRVATGIPSNVLDGLEANLAALKRSSDLPTPARRDVIAAVIEALRLKAEHCRTNPDGMAAQVAA